MKKFIPAFLIIILAISVFCGCTAKATAEVEPTIVATFEPTETTPVTEPPVIEPEFTEPVVEETTPPTVDEVPKYNQLDYTCPFGNVTLESNGKQATVQNSGCGITCLAMVATYMLDDPTLTPDVLAEQFGKYNTKVGASWNLFTEAAETLGLGEAKQVFDWRIGEVEDALRNGSLVISNQRGGIFTQGGHYILLTGIDEFGMVSVHDPNGANWTNPKLEICFEYGFPKSSVSRSSAAYWIYEPKNS